MNRKVLIAVLILIIIVGIWWFGLNNRIQKDLVDSKPKDSFETPSTTSIAPKIPKTFKFDSTTDLNAELEKVNPQLLDSDFE